MKILVGISGGVDSAYAAKKLASQGHIVEGAVLKMHEYTEISEAEIAALNVGIPLHIVDCRDAFDNIIRKNFVSEYLAGRTPNPCIICNEQVKFRFLYEYAVKCGFDAIATGHYAKIVRIENGNDTRLAFSQAEDLRKDQTYMLYRLPQHIIEKLVLPLGDSSKENVRAEAADSGIVAADRPDSQEICFLPDGGYPEYIERVAGKCPEGNFVDKDGNVIGKHKGIIHYTVGQRKGLGISLGERAFVTKIDSEGNTITLSPSHIGADCVRVRDVVYSGMAKPECGNLGEFDAKLRYGATPIKCVVMLGADGDLVLKFTSPVKAAPGQSAVLYRGGAVMCGGFIVESFESKVLEN